MGKNMRADAAIVESEEEETETAKPYAYYEQLLQQRIHHFYLADDIAEPNKYIDMVHKMQIASAFDIIHIHICSDGGNLSAALQIISAMRASPAHVKCELQCEAHSAASLIFLAADEFIVNPNSLIMIHDFSSGAFGKSAEHLSQITAEIEWFKTLAYNYYFPFLTNNEIEKVLKGNDLWLQTDEINKRLNRMIKIKQKEIEK